MKIKIKEIRFNGSGFKGSVASDIIGSNEFNDLVFVTPLQVDVFVEKLGQNILCGTTAFGRIRTVCSRCLADIENDFSENFLLTFDIPSNTEILDLEEDIRQEVVSRLPEKILCQPDCLGLCPHCGQNKNANKCNCELTPSGSPVVE